MAGLTDALLALDLIDRADEVVGNVVYGPWHKFYIPQDVGCTGWEVEQLLARHGVRIWGRGFTAQDLYFNVKQRQANWAEYLLRRRGIPVASQLVNPLNETYAARHAPGSEPPAWRRKAAPKPVRRRDWLDALLDVLLGR